MRALRFHILLNTKGQNGDRLTNFVPSNSGHRSWGLQAVHGSPVLHKAIFKIMKFQLKCLSGHFLVQI